MHVRDDQRLAQHLDHRDRGAHRGLEAKLHPSGGRRLEQLRAATGDELLVRRHDGSSGPQELEHEVAGRLDATHHLGNHLDGRVAEDHADVVGENARLGRERARLLHVADERVCDAQAVPGGALDLVGRLLEQPVHGGADGAVSEQRYGNVDGRHVPSARPCASARAAPCRRSRAATAPPRPASPSDEPRCCPCPPPTRGRRRRTGCRRGRSSLLRARARR